MPDQHRSAPVGGHESLNVEGNLEGQLLGWNMDDSTPLRQHDNVWIGATARAAHALTQAIVDSARSAYRAEDSGLVFRILVIMSFCLFATGWTFYIVMSGEFRPMLVAICFLDTHLSKCQIRMYEV